jgi:hypothetical protein
MVSMHQKLARSQARDGRGTFALGRIPHRILTGVAHRHCQCMHHQYRSRCGSPPPVAAKNKEEVLDIDESSPFEWTPLESKDNSNDPHMMRMSY